MTTYNFYISNKEIKEQCKDCLRGSWGTISSASSIVFFMCIIPLALAVLLPIFIVWWVAIPLGLFTLTVWAVMSYGFSNICLKLAKQEMPSKNEVFAGFSKKFMHVLRIAIKRVFLSIFWLIVLVVPFFVKNIGYTMSYFLLADRTDITSENAIKESCHIMQQNHKRYLNFIFSNFLWLMLILASAGITWIWIGPILRTKKAIFYENLKTEF